MQHRTIRLQRHPMIKITSQPAPRSFELPVHRMLCACALAPAPPGLTPAFPPAVSLCLDELQKFRLRHGRARDSERTDLDRVRPLFVVENKWLFVKRSQEKTSAGNLRISAERVRLAGLGRSQAGEKGCTPSISLPSVREGFRVHVLVENAQRDEIAFLFAEFSLLDTLQHPVAYRRHVGHGVVARRQPQAPTCIVRDGCRIVERVPVCTDRRLAARVP